MEDAKWYFVQLHSPRMVHGVASYTLKWGGRERERVNKIQLALTRQIWRGVNDDGDGDDDVEKK